MRLIWLLSPALFVIALAFWAYKENYRTKAAYDAVAQVRADISSARSELSKLRAEWAYLNRPERLSRLADQPFSHLGLMPMRAQQFATVADLPFPTIPAAAVGASVDVSFDGGQQ